MYIWTVSHTANTSQNNYGKINETISQTFRELLYIHRFGEKCTVRKSASGRLQLQHSVPVLNLWERRDRLMRIRRPAQICYKSRSHLQKIGAIIKNKILRVRNFLVFSVTKRELKLLHINDRQVLQCSVETCHALVRIRRKCTPSSTVARIRRQQCRWDILIRSSEKN
jgi:hypothetical protein